MLRSGILVGQAIFACRKTCRKGALTMEQKIPRKKSVLKQSRILNSIVHPQPSKEDPNGMYTGLPVEYGEVPVQDADDL